MRIIGLAVFVAALAGCATATDTASTTPPADRDCFAAHSVRGYELIDDNNIRIDVGASREYILGTMWDAHDLDWTQAIALRSTSGWICTGNGLGVEVIGGEPRRTYPINSITRAPDEAPIQGS